MNPKHIITLFSFLVLLTSSASYSQSRTSRQAVVPIGWENEDSLRFGIFAIKFAGSLECSNDPAAVDSLMDEAEVTFQPEWGFVDYDHALSGKRRGVLSGIDDTAGGLVSLRDLGFTVKQNVYYPSPTSVSLSWHAGPYWRYNDVNIDTGNSHWFNNEFDANDISPFAEYSQKPAFVTQAFTTKTPDDADTNVRVGDVGRVVLGYSDYRLADELFKSYHRYSFKSSLPPYDTARGFAARLEFNLNMSTIDTSNPDGREIEDLPLIRVQIAFKPPGQNVLPFVPFKTPQNNLRAGWYIGHAGANIHQIRT